jgi:hypothetical protein
MPDSFKKPAMGSQGARNERRVHPQYSLSADAEIVESQSPMKMSARMSDLSRLGFYAEMMGPFPRRAKVKMRILKTRCLSWHKQQTLTPQAGSGWDLNSWGLSLNRLLRSKSGSMS